MPETPSKFPPLSPADRALLLEIADPSRSHGSDSPHASHDVDPLARAHFLARPDIRPHLEALQAFRAFRAEIEHDHRVTRLADLLLEIARTTESLSRNASPLPPSSAC